VNAVTKIARREVSAALRRVGAAVDIGGLTDRELLELIRGSPLPGQLLGAAHAARQERRADLVARRDRERAATERNCAVLQQKCRDAQAAVAAKQTELDTAVRAASDARHELMSRDMRGRNFVSAIDVELELSASEAINAFVARMDAEWQSLRNRGALVVYGGSGHPADVAQDRQESIQQNQDVSLRMEGLRAAAAKAAELRLTALDGEPLLAALADIEAGMLELAKAARTARGAPT
jgi:hypothetical protein